MRDRRRVNLTRVTFHAEDTLVHQHERKDRQEKLAVTSFQKIYFCFCLYRRNLFIIHVLSFIYSLDSCVHVHLQIKCYLWADLTNIYYWTYGWMFSWCKSAEPPISFTLAEATTCYVYYIRDPFIWIGFTLVTIYRFLNPIYILMMMAESLPYLCFMQCRALNHCLMNILLYIIHKLKISVVGLVFS